MSWGAYLTGIVVGLLVADDHVWVAVLIAVAVGVIASVLAEGSK